MSDRTLRLMIGPVIAFFGCAVVNATDYQQILNKLNEDSDKTLAMKEFNPDWVSTLDGRGEPTTYTPANSAGFDYIGMPIGGICAGQLYLGGDGKLWCWDIFNTKTMRDVRGVPTHANPYKRSEPDLKAHHQVKQGFAIRLNHTGKTITRTLDRDGFQSITFRGQYPIGYVTFTDKDLPVRIDLEAFSPFIPLDLDNSTYPATVMAYTVTNTSDGEVSGELLGWLENAVCIKSRAIIPGQLHNRIERHDGLTVIACSASEPSGEPAAKVKRPEIVFEDFEGDLSKWNVEGDAFTGNPRPNFHHETLKGFKGKGLADSFCNSSKSNATGPDSDRHTGRLVSKPFTIERNAISLLVGGGNDRKRTCVKLVVDSQAVHTITGDNSETLKPHVFPVAGLQGKTAHIEIVDQRSEGWGHILVDHIVFTDDVQLIDQALEDQCDFGSMTLALIEGGSAVKATTSFNPPDGPFGNTTETTASFSDKSPIGALDRVFRLKPGEHITARFILSWYFPVLPDVPVRTPGGRHYGTRFRSAVDVAEHIFDNFEQLSSQTRLWHETWYNSTLPWWFLDRTFANTSILATNTCYLFSDGRFFGWEGVYHGNGTCTHVWGYVQAPGRLFPEIERRLREMVDYKPGIGFVPETGLIAYRAGYRFNDAVDGQSGVILRTYLVHQMQSDDAFGRRVYPFMKKAMDYLTNTYDADHDGILTGGQHNTLDAKWYGKITWLSLHYTAALRAAAAMADEMGDPDYAKHCRTLADRGRKYIEERLFNGEYFFHEADPEHHKSPGVFNGLEYSQLLGQSWAYQVGLGRILDPVKVTTHLKSLWKYNFTTDVGPFREKYKNGRWYAMPGEGGIIACTFPRGGDEALLQGNRHFAGYLNECQPGYEWAATSLMMWHDMPYHALAHTRTMHERYHGSRRNPWNEVEWGSHYSRSMASYGVFTSACGFEYNGPRGYIAFSPRIKPENFKAAFTSADGWGSFAQMRNDNTQTETLAVKYGKLRLKTLAFDLPAGAKAKQIHVTTAGKTLDNNHQMRESRITITPAETVTIPAGQSLSVQIQLVRTD